MSNARNKALGNTALNVVANQEYAQAVPHVIMLCLCILRLVNRVIPGALPYHSSALTQLFEQ